MSYIDRMQAESGFETYEALESEEFEFAFEGESGAYGEVYGEIGLESPFTEAEEMELAAELLEITSEEELDQFLGKLFKGAWRGIKKVGSAVGKIARPLGKALKGVAKVALPIAGKVAGGFFGGPIGGAIGGKLGSIVSKALEMEFEGLALEDREFEMAQKFVRVAGTAARQAALAQPGGDPQAAANAAVVAAARRHLPHFSKLAANPALPSAPGSTNSGRWIRRGRRIVLLGV